MALNRLWAGLKESSLLAKVGLVAGLVVLILLIAGGISRYKDAAYEKREAERVAERERDEAEKAQLRVEKQKALTEAAEATAQRDIYKQVAESKRADRVTTIKELEQIEVEHVQRKAGVEASGGSLSDVDLRRALCERMARRGYPPCPN